MSDLHGANDIGLKDRVVLVTGAGRGLGRSYAELLARHGAKVAVHDAGVDTAGGNPDPACAGAVADAIAAAGGDAVPIADVLDDADSCRRVVGAVLERYGRIDGLIHSAGLVAWQDPAETDEATYRRLTGVNTDAAFWLCRHVLSAMRDQGFGRIVLTTSGWALGPHRGAEELVLYCHGKGAQFGLAMGLANAAGHDEIKVNLLAPVANTRMYSGDVPVGKLDPARVAGAAAWLVSPACTVSGRIVAAADGNIALNRFAATETVELGADAADPGAAGRAILSLADAD